MSANCSKGKASIMNHLSGSVPLSPERLQQHKRKTSVRQGCHVHRASVAALEFCIFFLQRSHGKEHHYTGTKELATCPCVLNIDEMSLKHFREDKSHWLTQIRIHPSVVGHSRQQG